LILFLFGGLALFFPLAIYFLMLALINSRRRPTIMSGPWDFALVLLALSGFILVGGPSILAQFDRFWRFLLYQARFRTFLRALTLEAAQFGIWVWFCYVFLVLGGSAFLLWRRRRVTIIYNVLPGVLQHSLGRVFERLRLAPVRVANRIIFGLRPKQAPTLQEAIQTPRQASATLEFEASPDGAGESAADLPLPDAATGHLAMLTQLGELELDPFPSMRHVTLRWRGVDTTLRRDIEAELAKILAEVESPENPIAGWLMTIVGFFTLLILGCMVLIFVFEVFH